MTIFARLILVLAALMFAGLGVYLLKEPGKLDEWIGLRATTAESLTELRALYGGLEIGLGLFLLLCALRQPWISAGCACLVFVCGGIAIARVIGFFIDASFNNMMLGFLATEIVFAVLGAIAWVGHSPD